MDRKQDPAQVHCYTNPSFCRQSEYIPEDGHSDGEDLPPPPQLQLDDLPSPQIIHQTQSQYGQSNPAFNASPETEQNNQNQLHRNVDSLNHTNIDRYCYIDNSIDQQSLPVVTISHKPYDLPIGESDYRPYSYRVNRYEYIQDDTSLVQQQLQKKQLQQQQQITTLGAHSSSMYQFIEHHPVQQKTASLQHQSQLQQQVVVPSGQNSMRASVRSYRNVDAHYTMLDPGRNEAQETQWNDESGSGWNSSKKQISTPRGRYTSLPMQDEDPPSLPERNLHEVAQRINNVATQKLHEILTTPRKPKTRLHADTLSPIKSPCKQQPMLHNIAPTQRNAFTPGCSPSSSLTGQRAINSPMRPQQHQQQNMPHNRTMSPRDKGLTTSTPNKQPPSARRCLPLNTESAGLGPMLRRHIENSQVLYGSAYGERQRKTSAAAALYQGVEDAFIARTAVVPPLSPPVSEVNTTLVSGTEKSDRKNAPLILVLVGILTCGLASYLSWTQGRRYYFDSAIGCGACCALAGACRSMRRTWTGLGLAGLAALSCAGLLLLAAKSPRSGTPLHDITAGALCGVSLIGAILALLALLAPRCTFGRHRRVHSWIPRFSP